MKNFLSGKTGRWTATAIVLGCIAALWFFRSSIVWKAASFLTVDTPVSRAQILITMGGSPERRIPHSIGLFKNGLSDRLLIITGKPEPDREACYQKYGVPLPDSLLAAVIAEKSGLEPGEYTIADRSLSTLDDCILAYRHYRRRPFSTAVIVTDSLHSRRSLICMQRVFKGEKVHFYSMPIPLTAERMNQKDDFLLYTADEYLKLLYYSLNLKKPGL